MAGRELIRTASTACLAAAALNVIALTIAGHYDLRMGPLHLEATNLFKPLLYLNAAFLLCLAARPASRLAATQESLLDFRFWLAAAAIVAVAYGVSFRINLEYTDWTHRPLTNGVSPLSFFTQGQYDGFYRPLTFLSLWIDNRLFGAALWAYHIQNVLIHLLNGALVARLAWRLKLGVRAARWAGLLFLALPAGFEAVIWPGARFDLLATAFTLFAIERALAGAVVVSVAAYALGVLSKESAYCYPLIVGALYLLRRPLALPLDRNRTLRILTAAVFVTLVLISVRIAVYGGASRKTGTEVSEMVPLKLTAKTFTATPTRIPAALYLVNASAGFPPWLRIAIAGYALALCGIVAGGAGLGSQAALLLIAFLAAAPTFNIMGWINPAAQQSRYLYQPAAWIICAVAAAMAARRHGALWTAVLIVCMAAAALFNTLAYLHMLSAAEAAAKHGHCADLPTTLYGAFYFRDEVGQRIIGLSNCLPLN